MRLTNWEILEGTRDNVQGAPDMFCAGHELDLYGESEGYVWFGACGSVRFLSYSLG